MNKLMLFVAVALVVAMGVGAWYANHTDPCGSGPRSDASECFKRRHRWERAPDGRLVPCIVLERGPSCDWDYGRRDTVGDGH